MFSFSWLQVLGCGIIQPVTELPFSLEHYIRTSLSQSPPKATIQLVKNHLEHFSSGVCTWLAKSSSTVELQLSYLGVYFDGNLILVLASAGLSWLSLSALITLLSTQGAAAHNFPVCACCFVRCTLSILKSAAVINEQNFNLLSSSHLNVGTF